MRTRRRACSTSRTWARSRPRARRREEFLQHLLSNDVTKLAERGAQYSVLCREDGGVLDDLFTYRLDGGRFLTVTNASNHEKDLAWFRRHAEGFDVEVSDAHAAWAMLAVQGPGARAALERIAGGELPDAHAHRGACGGGRRGARVRHRLHRRGRLRADDRARGRRRGLGRAAGRGRQADRARRARHAAPRGLLPPLRQRPVRGPQPDRGRPGLVLQARHGLHRRRGAAPTSSPSRRSSRSPSPAPASRARATRSTRRTATAWSPAARCRRAWRSGIGMAYVPVAAAEPGTAIEVDVRGKPRAAEVRERAALSTRGVQWLKPATPTT